MLLPIIRTRLSHRSYSPATCSTHRQESRRREAWAVERPGRYSAAVADGADAPTGAVIEAFCREYLAGYKCPKRVEFRTELARTATGKLQKFKLRAPFWEGRERQVN